MLIFENFFFVWRILIRWNSIEAQVVCQLCQYRFQEKNYGRRRVGLVRNTLAPSKSDTVIFLLDNL